MKSSKADPSLSRHVDGLWDSDPELFLVAESVEQLQSHPGFAAVMAVLREEVASIDRKLDGSPLETPAEYAQQHGRRGALLSAEGAAKAILEKAGKRREAAQQAINDAEGESSAEGR